jgi:hypothetical protein
MKKDINPPKVENIAVSITKEVNELGGIEWFVYLINLKDELIEGVMVTSRGYGEINGEHKKTATLRSFLDELEPNSFKRIESLTEDLLALSNEFWVSFYHNKQLFDKKYIFLAESVTEENEVNLPIIGKKGILIK